MNALAPSSRVTCTRRTLVVVANSKIPKINVEKQGMQSIKNKVVQNNLKGISDKMKDKNWTDASGRKGARRVVEPRCASLRPHRER